jgi:hypothetical protein
MRYLSLFLLTLPVAADTQQIFDRAVADFRAARIPESVRGFDEVAKMAPAAAPQLWQRGIAQYYAGRYKACREQFESHRTVNPNDVENAAWHFLCVARAESAASATKALLPVGPDGRVPMREVYAMFRGDMTPEQVLKRAGSDNEAQFYAHLYIGLYSEATGQSALALKHIREAAQDRYAAGGYMHTVAQVHLALLQKQAMTAEVWNFDRLDRLGAHSTKVQGNPRVVDTPKGKAVEFDGVDDALFLDVHPLAGAETFTWEVIFRPDRAGSPEQRFFHLQENGSETRLLFETRLVGDDWYLDSFANSGESRALMRKDRLHKLGEWYHVAMVYDGKEFRNYVDGELEGAAQVQLKPQGPGRTSAGVRINLKDYFKGAIRTSRFTRRALTPSEFMKK